jgi:hypothetical protein
MLIPHGMHGDPIASRTGRAPRGVLRVNLAGYRTLDMRAEIEQWGTQGTFCRPCLIS